jgi:hypothetical protein
VKMHGAAARAAILVFLAPLAACGGDIPPGLHGADLEVGWSIGGSTAPGLCDTHGIERWVVGVRGPEPREVHLDCRLQEWNSATYLHDLDEGAYAVGVRALDPLGGARARSMTDLRLVEDGAIDIVELTFAARDWHAACKRGAPCQRKRTK